MAAVLEPHGHDHAQIVAAVAGLDKGRIQIATKLDADFLAAHLCQQIDEVAGVETNLQSPALVIHVHLLLRVAQIRVIRLDGQLALLQGKANAPRLVRGDDRHSTKRVPARSSCRCPWG